MAHDPETKARAIAMLISGIAAAEVSSKLDVPIPTMHRWRRECTDDEYLGRIIGKNDNRTKNDNMVSKSDQPDLPVVLDDPKPLKAEEMRAEAVRVRVYGYLCQAFETLTRQAEILGDEEYLRSQSVADVAIAHGELFGNTVQILRASESARPTDGGAAGEGAEVP